MVDGKPVIRAYFVPRREVEFLGGWDVMGLIGTGSYDYAISERVVPAGFTFSITNPDQHRGGPLYGLGVLGMTSIGHAGFALGVSRRAIDEVVALAGRKQRLGHATPVAGIERFQYELGRDTAMLKAARALLFDVVRRGAAAARLRGQARSRSERLDPAAGDHPRRPRQLRGGRFRLPLVRRRRHPARASCSGSGATPTPAPSTSSSTTTPSPTYGRHLLTEAGALTA